MSTDQNIHFFFEDTEEIQLNHSLLSTWILQLLNRSEFDLNTINFIFGSDEYILKINQEYLDHDYYTDIITFPMSDNPIESDIFISVDRVRENASDLKISFEDELHRVMIHGVLHLIGQNDKSPEEKNLMTAAENSALEKLKILKGQLD